MPPGPASTTSGCASDALPQLTATATRLAFDSDYETVLAVKARRDRLDAAIEQMAADCEFTPLVRRLGCLRGISTLTGFALAVEIGDWHRFTGNTIGSFVGLVPASTPRVPHESQGSITKTGNGHVRRLLVEAAWHHRARYTVGKTMRDRWDLAPAAARARGDEGNRRLHHRWVTLPRAPQAAHRRQRRDRPRAGRLVLVPGRPRRARPTRPASPPRRLVAARGATRDSTYEQPATRRPRSTLDTRTRSSRTHRPAVTNPRISV